jgi:fatty acid synthase subunit alpha
MAATVMKNLGLEPASSKTQHSRPDAAVSTVPSEALQALQREQREQDRRLLEVYARRCGYDLSDVRAVTDKQRIIDDLQARVDAWSAELGDEFERGIQPQFDALKSRTYDSYWNWVMQDLVTTFAKMMTGRPVGADMHQFTTRMTPRLVNAISYLQTSLEVFPDSPGKTVTKRFLCDLKTACELAKGHPQPFRLSVPSTVPILNIDDDGKISVQEVLRNSTNDTHPPQASFALRVEGASEASVSSSGDSTMADSDIFSALDTAYSSPGVLATSTATSVASDMPTDVAVTHQPCATSTLEFMDGDQASAPSPDMPSLKVKLSSGFEHDGFLTRSYMQWFSGAATSGVSMIETSVVVTGAGKNSIGAEVVKHLLSAGAKVLVTTSSYRPETLAFYEDMYHAHGSAASQLVVVPFNAASTQDTRRLVAYVYEDLGWDVDHIVPFAAIGEGGRDVSEIDGHSELAHRAMLTNVLRLLGSIKDIKAARGIDTHPTQVILPLSPNHGGFGNDGLYAESKIGLEALLNKWGSEDWSDYLSVCGAVIGWVRGTNLMHGNDVVATGIEKELHIRTFSRVEMAWHIVGLMDARIRDVCDIGPVVADLSGGMKAEMDLRRASNHIKESINRQSELQKALAKEGAMDNGNPVSSSSPEESQTLGQRARIRVEGQDLPRWEEDIKPLHKLLEGMVDLDRVVVAVGFGETGEPMTF